MVAVKRMVGPIHSLECLIKCGSISSSFSIEDNWIPAFCRIFLVVSILSSYAENES